ncbi:MAG: TIGR04282 family arsenosugar biosynthesis glycosyltransferase [Brumimicrobium sp.]|nr:TIGR04282 family arsenosugar biosynthesis glycosyltransferase [Brumimicrobium sp.]
MNKELLIIFTKNPELGKCKTRLAATIGDQAALTVYEQLLDYTVDFTKELKLTKRVYYSHRVNENDRWPNNIFEKKEQCEGDLGKKMLDAFKTGFEHGFTKIAIIGSDCAEINGEDITIAFEVLEHNQVVIGPAIDGGYYLLGMNTLIPDLFSKKSWSTEKLMGETIQTLEEKQINYALLEEKSDIDFEDDLRRKGYINFQY